MIVILEDDADREAFGKGNPFNTEFFDHATMRKPTVWTSPEAYAEERVLPEAMEGAKIGTQIAIQIVLNRLREEMEVLPHNSGCDSFAVMYPGECDCLRAVVLARFADLRVPFAGAP